MCYFHIMTLELKKIKSITYDIKEYFQLVTVRIDSIDCVVTLV
jgi:hypothetical protein